MEKKNDHSWENKRIWELPQLKFSTIWQIHDEQTNVEWWLKVAFVTGTYCNKQGSFITGVLVCSFICSLWQLCTVPICSVPTANCTYWASASHYTVPTGLQSFNFRPTVVAPSMKQVPKGLRTRKRVRATVVTAGHCTHAKPSREHALACC